MAEQVLIDVKALLHEVTEANIAGFYEANEHSRETYYEIEQIIKNAPVIEERKTGTWIDDELDGSEVYRCSNCYHLVPKKYFRDEYCVFKNGEWTKEHAYNFCPNCGSRNV